MAEQDDGRVDELEQHVDAVKSRAVVLYLSVGRASYPKHNPGALDSAFTPVEADELRGYVESLLTEMYALPVNWQMHSLLSGTYAVEAELRVRHPELSDDAIHALGWDFSYSWK